MKSPLISIAIIAYNESEKIEDTIQSVINQTYKNIELIVILEIFHITVTVVSRL